MFKEIFQELDYLVTVLVTLTITIVIASFVNRLFHKMIINKAVKHELDTTNFKFLQHSLVALIYVVGISLAIYHIPNLRHIATTLLTGAGILAAIVGFASQQALSNIISGIFIIIFKPYRIDDRITFKGDLTGKVEDIGLRHTVIRDYENRRIIIPNSVISNDYIINADHTEQIICKWVELDIAYTANISKAKTIITEEALKHPFFVDNRTKKEINGGAVEVPVRVISMGNSSIRLRAWTWALDPGKAFIMGCDLLESIKDRFDREGVEIPYPYQNVILKTPDQS